jgi:RimJ/RimL family protein N-acetyltransferase
MKLATDTPYFWEGEKVRLRPLKSSDAKRKWEEWMETDTRRLLEYKLDLPPVSLEEYTRQLEDSLEFKDTSKITSFAIDSLDGEFVGWINLVFGSPRHGNFTFGISVFKEHQKKGYAVEAVNMILHYGFNERRYHRCSSECIETNIGSIRLHEKLGFTEEGRRRKLLYMNNQYYDEVLFGLLKSEFNANHTEG